MCRPPQKKQHEGHHAQLVDIVPRLYSHLVQSYTTSRRWCHQEFVVESGNGAQDIAEQHKDNPFVVLKVDTFFLSASREEVESNHGCNHTQPLEEREFLTKDGKGTDEHHDGACGVDRSDDGQGQVLDAEVAEEPR